MAATGKTPILLYGSTTATNTPVAGNLTNSSDGCEIAINVADKNLFFKDSTNTVNTVPIRQSSGSSDGWLSSANWTTFNSKQAAYANLTSIGSLANATGWLYNNGSGVYTYSTPTATNVGLGNVTNDTQTKAAIVPNTVPSNGQLLIGNGTNYSVSTLTAGTNISITNASGGITIAATASGVAPTVTVYTSGSGTFTTPANAKALWVRMVGGGGGGAGSGGSGTSGGTGGATSFGSAYCLGGAGGALNATLGGAGGASTTAGVGGGLNLTGGSGTAGVTGGTYPIGGAGGNSPFGGGGSGSGGSSAGTGGSAVSNTGGGGGGAGTGTVGTFTGAGGGAGGYVDMIVSSPSATYSYAVGAGGTSGTGSSNGGTGGSGVIMIVVFY
jgi:hypothetical protein